MIDIQIDKQREELIEAAESKEGKLIVKFLKQRLSEVDTNKIVRKGRLKEKVDIEFWAKSEAREYLTKIINILNPQ